jgi:hypothetical protein
VFDEWIKVGNKLQEAQKVSVCRIPQHFIVPAQSKSSFCQKFTSHYALKDFANTVLDSRIARLYTYYQTVSCLLLLATEALIAGAERCFHGR